MFRGPYFSNLGIWRMSFASCLNLLHPVTLARTSPPEPSAHNAVADAWARTPYRTASPWAVTNHRSTWKFKPALLQLQYTQCHVWFYITLPRVRFEVFAAVTMKNVFWDVMLCRYCVNRRFGGSMTSIFRLEKSASGEPASEGGSVYLVCGLLKWN
jgi:hypothetical protein